MCSKLIVAILIMCSTIREASADNLCKQENARNHSLGISQYTEVFFEKSKSRFCYVIIKSGMEKSRTLDAEGKPRFSIEAENEFVSKLIDNAPLGIKKVTQGHQRSAIGNLLSHRGGPDIPEASQRFTGMTFLHEVSEWDDDVLTFTKPKHWFGNDTAATFLLHTGTWSSYGDGAEGPNKYTVVCKQITANKQSMAASRMASLLFTLFATVY